MIETFLSVNGQDCAGGAGNTPEEYEAMAATLLRVAQAIRDSEHGVIQCLREDGQVLVSAIVHNRELARNGAEIEFPTIERLQCAGESSDQTISFRNMSRSMIEHYRPLKAKSL